MTVADLSLPRSDISAFLGVDVPSNISHLSKMEPRQVVQKSVRLSLVNSGSTSPIPYPQVRHLSREQIYDLYPEREPGLRINRAAICAQGSQHIIFAPFIVTERMCAGHMPGFPILPLAEAGRTLAQTGAILVAYWVRELEGRRGCFTPLVYKVGEIQSFQKGFLYPGDRICLVAQARKLRGPLYEVEAHGYLKDEHIFAMPLIQYFVAQDPKLWQQQEVYNV